MWRGKTWESLHIGSVIVAAHLTHNVLSHSQSLFLHLHHVVFFIFGVVHLLQLEDT